MAASFKAVSRKLGRTLKQVATKRSWGLLGALVGATVGSVLLRRAQATGASRESTESLQAKKPAVLPELVPAPVAELTPPHGDPITRGVTKAPRTKKRSRAQTSHELKPSAEVQAQGDADASIQASAASASEREPAPLSPPPPTKGVKRTRGTHAPRRGRSHPAK